jgi:hypothetical protein
MKHVVLVAGMDYEFKGVNFRLFCQNRMTRLLTANKKKEDMTFQLFDARAGEVEKHEVTYPAGKKTVKVTKTNPFTKLSKTNFNQRTVGGETHYEFKNGQTGIMSILDIYAAVRQIGKDAADTLMELSFFSHAWHGGPILVNSFDDGRVEGPPATPGGPPTVTMLPGSTRDPDDNDPRAAKDFIPPTMSASELKEFRDAYHPDGYNWSWGCSFPRVIHEILYKLEHHANYKEHGLADGDKFIFTNFRDNHVQSLVTRLGISVPNKRRVELTFKELKRYFCSATVDSYNHHLAVKSARKTFAGVIGTYSEYDIGPLPLMHVYNGFGRHFRFYKNYLGFAFDPERRNYGEFSPTFTC